MEILQAVTEQVREMAAALGEVEATVTEHGQRLELLVARVPADVWSKVSTAVATHYGNLEERYGRRTAIAILSAGIVGAVVPVPGTSVLAMAPLIAVAELHHRLGTQPESNAALGNAQQLTHPEVMKFGSHWMQVLSNALKSAD
jgi:hypothetical protein